MIDRKHYEDIREIRDLANRIKGFATANNNQPVIEWAETILANLDRIQGIATKERREESK